MADLNIESLKIKSEIKGEILENVKGITSAQMLLICKAFDDAMQRVIVRLLENEIMIVIKASLKCGAFCCIKS